MHFEKKKQTTKQNLNQNLFNKKANQTYQLKTQLTQNIKSCKQIKHTQKKQQNLRKNGT